MKPTTAKQQRPAERPEAKVISLAKLRCEREKVQQQAKELKLNIRADVLLGFEGVADELNLSVDALATAVLEAFTALVNEDHGIQFPLMLQQVEIV